MSFLFNYIIMGILSLKQVLTKTKFSKHKNRFDYAKRDVLKGIQVQRIKSLKYGALKLGETNTLEKFKILSFSYPQYKPYIKVKDKRSKKQRKIKHTYEIILEMNELTLNTKFWKLSVGSKKKWDDNPPQKYLKTSKLSTIKKLRVEAENKFKTKKEQDTFVREARKKIKAKGIYLDVGDYNSRKLGLNGDFYFSQQFVFYKLGHLFGKCTLKESDNTHIYFGKHEINLIEQLMKRGILKDN